MSFFTVSFLAFLALTAFFAAKTQREVREILENNKPGGIKWN